MTECLDSTPLFKTRGGKADQEGIVKERVQGEDGPVLDEQPQGGRVLVRIARGEALVGAVEEDDMVLGLHGRRDLRPLLDGRVDAGRVVRAGVQQEERAGLINHSPRRLGPSC